MHASVRSRSTPPAAVLFLAAALLAPPSGLPAQEWRGRNPVRVSASAPARASEWGAVHPVDVLRYDLRLRLGMRDASLDGRVLIRLITLNGTVELHAAALEIDSARVDGLPATISVPAAETIRLLAGGVYAPGDTLDVELWYRRRPELPRPSWRDGYYWFSKDSVPGLPATVGYTMSQPSDTRFWLPCHDVPDDKATADITITVPEGIVAASNGRLDGRRVNGDGTVTWQWRETHPIAPYLLCVTASEFTVSTLPFTRAPGDTLPLQYYVWREDSAACAAFLPTVRQMMQLLSSRFGPYPYDKYGMTAVAPFAFGGMEHQTITTMHRALKTHPAVVVHELAHQWWGNLVTCATWKDIWLNEGFASYCEALWEESLGGEARLNTYMNAEFSNFSSASWEGAIYDPESQGFDLFSMAVYTKGAWVLHMLRGVVGDPHFFQSLLAYRAAYAGGNASTEGFRDIVETIAGRDLDRFFEQWIHGRGWPEYACSWNWRADTLRVRITQQQRPDFWPAFVMPVELKAFSAAGDTLLVVPDSLRTQDFILPLGRRVDSLAFDPHSRILKRMSGPVTAARDPVHPEGFSLDPNYPNPFNPVTVIPCSWPTTGRVRLAVYDLLGREVAVLLDEVRPPGSARLRFDGTGLASGVYVCRFSAGGRTLARTMLLLR